MEGLVGRRAAVHTPVFVLTHHPRRRLRWREDGVRLSTKAFTPLWSRRALQRAAATSASVEAYPSFGSICGAA